MCVCVANSLEMLFLIAPETFPADLGVWDMTILDCERLNCLKCLRDLPTEIVSIVLQCTFNQLQFYGSYTHPKLFSQPNLKSQNVLVRYTPFLTVGSALDLIPLPLWQRSGMDDNTEELVPKNNLTSVIWNRLGFSKTVTVQTTAICKNCKDKVCTSDGNRQDKLLTTSKESTRKSILTVKQ